MGEQRNKGNRLTDFVDDYVVIDLETTSRIISNTEIVEISALKVIGGNTSETYSTLVKPDYSIPYSATAINHIDNSMVSNAPSIADVIDEFLQFIGDSILIGHNITTFDTNILYDRIYDLRGIEFNNDYIDTLYMARRCLPELENHKLESVSKYFGIDVSGEHRALNDCFIDNNCYKRMRDIYESGNIDIIPHKKRINGSHRKHTQTNETKALQILHEYLNVIVENGELSSEDIYDLKEWVDENIDLADNYPFDEVVMAINQVLEDGVIEQCELKYLLGIFDEYSNPVEHATHQRITSIFEKHCCVTGDFEHGSRSEIETYIVDHGGICDKCVKKATDYVIVGAKGSEAWKLGNYGGKIKKAIEYANNGIDIEIVEEDAFFNEIDGGDR